jgi:hypothetical protein
LDKEAPQERNNGGRVASRRWVPQGGNPPPLLSGIYLAEFDLTLEDRRRKFFRCVDGRGICARPSGDGRVHQVSGREAEAHKANRKKSAVGNPTKLEFLRFSFCWSKEGVRARGKVLKRLWERLKALEANRGHRSDAGEVAVLLCVIASKICLKIM